MAETRRSSSVVSAATTTTTSLSFFRRHRKKNAATTPTTAQPLLSRTKPKHSTRVARLASMFGNTGPSEENSLEIPPSPSTSTTSSFVAWPGTQDKRGVIVKNASSSFEGCSSVASFSNNFRVNYEQELEGAASLQVQSWMSSNPQVQSKLTPLEQRIEHGPPSDDSEEEEVKVNNNAADFALAAVVAHAANSTVSPIPSSSKRNAVSSKTKTSSSSTTGSSAIAMENLFDKRHNWETTPDDHATTITREALERNDSLHAIPFYQQVPNLMDGLDSDASSSRATSTTFRKPASDVFEGIAESSQAGIPEEEVYHDNVVPYSNYNRPADDEDELNVVVLPSGLITIQTPQIDFEERRTSREYDETLTNSEVDQYGFIKLPAFDSPSNNNLQPPLRRPIGRMEEETQSESSSSSSCFESPHVSHYAVSPQATKKLVRAFRHFSEHDHDAKRAFALVEMRSRIMEKDMERGLERRGGTAVCDDLVLTSHAQASCRIRDAVIVAKAWRDGANPRNVVTAFQLTRPHDYYVERQQHYELVEWMDDADFMQFKCPSLGPRCMRGFEMFTIGDCQSILLKLTNERCMQLRAELNDATSLQIEAEEVMKREEEEDMNDQHGMMTEAEMTYLTSMEQVKALSKQLVVAERSFHLVRDRIEQLVARYENLLVRIENESLVAPSSVVTFDSSRVSTDYEDYEKQILARRAQRAEIKAELVAREAMLAKQEAEKNLEEKERELEELQQRLQELQSEPSHVFPEREHSVILAKAIAANSGHHSPSLLDTTQERIQQQTDQESALQESLYQEKINGVKQKFRDRMAERKKSTAPSAKSQRNQVLSGEEMFQYLDFYERSLKAVEHQRAEGVVVPEYRHST